MLASTPLHIFGGLSIALDKIKRLAPRATVHGPIRRFDLPQILEQEKTPGTIAIIDGVFHSHETCSLTELREMADAGWKLVGASSMGALRSLEAAPLGMQGVGQVFRWLRMFAVEDDDEVAQIIDPDDLKALSLAMVDIRWIVNRLRKTKHLTYQASYEIISACKKTYYPGRTACLLAELVEKHGSKESVRQIPNICLPKQRDAERLVAALARKWP